MGIASIWLLSFLINVIAALVIAVAAYSTEPSQQATSSAGWNLSRRQVREPGCLSGFCPRRRKTSDQAAKAPQQIFKSQDESALGKKQAGRATDEQRRRDEKEKAQIKSPFDLRQQNKQTHEKSAEQRSMHQLGSGFHYQRSKSGASKSTLQSGQLTRHGQIAPMFGEVKDPFHTEASSRLGNKVIRERKSLPLVPNDPVKGPNNAGLRYDEEHPAESPARREQDNGRHTPRSSSRRNSGRTSSKTRDTEAMGPMIIGHNNIRHMKIEYPQGVPRSQTWREAAKSNREYFDARHTGEGGYVQGPSVSFRIANQTPGFSFSSFQGGKERPPQGTRRANPELNHYLQQGWRLGRQKPEQSRSMSGIASSSADVNPSSDQSTQDGVGSSSRHLQTSARTKRG